jgi:hypothetical protein
MDEALRHLVRERAGHRCEYCRLPQAYAPVVRFHIEHIRARQHGGDDDPANLALACPHCNRCKGPNLTSVDPETATVAPLFHPRLDVWDTHFVVDDVLIIGRTPIGRATVRLLRMNTDDRQKVRAALRARGEWTS